MEGDAQPVHRQPRHRARRQPVPRRHARRRQRRRDLQRRQPLHAHDHSSHLSGNHANEGGGAIFFVSNDRTGTLAIKDSVLQRNRSDGFQTAGLPGIYFLGAGRPAIVGSVLR